MNIIWIVVFVSLLQHEGDEFATSPLTYYETASLEECRATIPVFLKEAKAHKVIKAVGVTTDCFPYDGTIEEYEAEQVRLYNTEE